jgi:hypothetical protein
LNCFSLITCPSARPPSALTVNDSALRRSLKVSNTNTTLSLPDQRMPLSRRISVATSRSICESHTRNDT